MIAFIRSLPQGMLWYPTVLALAFVIGRSLWKTRRPDTRARATENVSTDNLAALTRLTTRARTDMNARRELERRCVGLLLQANGYPRYSVENCRAFLADTPDSDVTGALRAHLHDITQPANREPAQNAGNRSPKERIATILSAVEQMTEVHHE